MDQGGKIKKEENRTLKNVVEMERIDCCEKEGRLLTDMRESVREW